jgi:hypothetical protein
MDEFAAFSEAFPAPAPKPEMVMECPHCHKRVGRLVRRYLVHQDTPGMWQVLIEDGRQRPTFGLERECDDCGVTYSWQASISGCGKHTAFE